MTMRGPYRSPWVSGGTSGGGGGGDIHEIVDLTVNQAQIMQDAGTLKKGQFYRITNAMANTWAVIVMAIAADQMGNVGEGIYGGISGTLFCDITYNLGVNIGDTDKLEKVWDPQYGNYVEGYAAILKFRWDNSLWTKNRVQSGSLIDFTGTVDIGNVSGNVLNGASTLTGNAGTHIGNVQYNSLTGQSHIYLSDCVANSEISFNTISGLSAIDARNGSIGECMYNEIYGNSFMIIKFSAGSCDCSANTIGGGAQIVTDSNTICLRVGNNMVIGNDLGSGVLDLSGVNMAGFSCTENSMTNGAIMDFDSSVVAGNVEHNTLQGQSRFEFSSSNIKGVKNNILSEESVIIGDSSTHIQNQIQFNSLSGGSTINLESCESAGEVSYNTLTGASTLELPITSITTIKYNSLSGGSSITAQAGTVFDGVAMDSNTLTGKTIITIDSGVDYTIDFSENFFNKSTIEFGGGSLFNNCDVSGMEAIVDGGLSWTFDSYVKGGNSTFDIPLDMSDAAIFSGNTLTFPVNYKGYIGVFRLTNVPVGCTVDSFVNDEFETFYTLYGDTGATNSVTWAFLPLPANYSHLAADPYSWVTFSHLSSLVHDFLNYDTPAPSGSIEIYQFSTSAGVDTYALPAGFAGKTLNIVNKDNMPQITFGPNAQVALIAGPSLQLTDLTFPITAGIAIYVQAS